MTTLTRSSGGLYLTGQEHQAFTLPAGERVIREVGTGVQSENEEKNEGTDEH